MPAAPPPMTVSPQQLKVMADDLARVVKDFSYFMEQHVYILDPQRNLKLKWQHWPCHEKVIDVLTHNQLVIVLKSRQLGISWLAIAYAFWLCGYHYGSRVAVFSKREEEAIKLLERAKYIHRNLPDHLRPAVEKDNDTSFTFRGLDSGLFAFPATEDAGRMEAANLVLCDEWAFHPEADRQYAAMKPTIDGGGKFIGISTANGAGNFFHAVWQSASEGRNNFAPVFLGWRERPGRDDEWYARQTQDYPPSLLRQEYPATPSEAFVQTGHPLFDASYLEVRAFHHKALPFDGLPHPLRVDPHIEVFQLPRPGRKYCIGMDVAEGEWTPGFSEEPDCTCLTVLDHEANEQVLHLHGRWDTTRQAEMADAIARFYAPAVLGVERNGLGLAVIKKLEELGTPGLFRERAILNRQGEVDKPGKHGWHTNSSTKPMMLLELEEHLRHGYTRVAAQRFIDEALIFQDLGGGKYGAPKGFHDDCCIAYAIALQMRKNVNQIAYEGSRVHKGRAALRMVAVG